MSNLDFAHSLFRGDTWESEVKNFIQSLSLPPQSLWFREGEALKKLSSELVSLGYYVKYRYGADPAMTFLLNQVQGQVDGWVYSDGHQISAVQIVTAYYDTEEAAQDTELLRGVAVVPGGWVEDRLCQLTLRLVDRLQNKVGHRYKGVDLLLVGFKDLFVRRSYGDYPQFGERVNWIVEKWLERSSFTEIVLVDTDLVATGELRVFSKHGVHGGA
jgi:hypothetical protein